MIPEYVTQLPVFSAARLLRAGVSWAGVDAAVRAGELTRLKRGWFTAEPTPWPSDRHRLLVQVELAQRRGLVASHYSGALLSGLAVHAVDWSTVHLMRTGEGPARNRPGLVIHQRVPVADELRLALVIAQTSLLCGISGLMALDGALAADSVEKAQVRRRANTFAGRPGFSRLGTVVRLGDSRRESPLESWTALVYDGWGFQLEPQFHVPGTNYRADARISGTRVLLESDGEQKYTTPQVVLAEKTREDDLRVAGWQVVRVTKRLLCAPEELRDRTRVALLLAARWRH